MPGRPLEPPRAGTTASTRGLLIERGLHGSGGVPPPVRCQHVDRRRPDVSSWALVGAGGHARVLHDVLVRSGATVVAVSGDSRGPAWDVPVLDDDDELAALVARTGAVVALGWVTGTSAPGCWSGLRLAACRCPRWSRRPPPWRRSATLGAGTVVLEHAHVGPSARLGRGVVVNTAAVVEHDVVVGDGSHVAPAAVLLGAAEVGAGTLVGSGARVLPGIRVGDHLQQGRGQLARRSAQGSAVPLFRVSRPP